MAQTITMRFEPAPATKQVTPAETADSLDYVEGKLSANGLYSRVEALLGGPAKEAHKLRMGEMGIDDAAEQISALKREIIGAEFVLDNANIRIEEVLGNGMMAVVCKATLTTVDGEEKTVAVKLCPTHGESGMKSFQIRRKVAIREAEMMHALRGITIFPQLEGQGVIQAQGENDPALHIIAMDYIDGTTAAEHMKELLPSLDTQNELPALGQAIIEKLANRVEDERVYWECHQLLEYVLGLSMDVTEALHHAHERGISYNDLKLSNILFNSHRGKNGRNMLIDVGNAFDFGKYTVQMNGRSYQLVDRNNPAKEVPEHLQGMMPSASANTYVSRNERFTIEPYRDVGSLGMLLKSILDRTKLTQMLETVDIQTSEDSPYYALVNVSRQLMDLSNALKASTPERSYNLAAAHGWLQEMKEMLKHNYQEAPTNLVAS